MHCNGANNRPDKKLGQLITIASHSLTMLKTTYAEF